VKQQIELDTAMLELFKTATNADRQQRALDCANSLLLPRSVMIAIRWAQMSNITNLTDKISEEAKKRGYSSIEPSGHHPPQFTASSSKSVVNTLPPCDTSGSDEDQERVSKKQRTNYTPTKPVKVIVVDNDKVAKKDNKDTSVYDSASEKHLDTKPDPFIKKSPTKQPRSVIDIFDTLNRTKSAQQTSNPPSKKRKQSALWGEVL